MKGTPRNKLLEISMIERQHTFKETTLTYDKDVAINEAKRCLNCKSAPCRQGCPVGVNIPLFISKIADSNFDSAVQVVKATNALPAVCGRVCPQSEQCEKLCVRGKNGSAVAIGCLERFLGDYAIDNGIYCAAVGANTLKAGHGSVAIIGSGPASLTCACECIQNGYKVVVFEALHALGGVLIYGIPEFRLPKRLVDAEIKSLVSLGVKFEINTLIGRSISFSDLRKRFDAVFIGTGAGLPNFMDIEGENLNGVYSANEYLTRVNLMKAYLDESDTPIMRARNVLVIGGGNVAFDSARTAMRLGSKSVVLAYRRTKDEIPARVEEVEQAEIEGVIISILSIPVKLLSDDNGNVRGAILKKCKLSEMDVRGRRSFEIIENTDYEIECDLVIVAIGTNPNPIVKECFSDLVTDSVGRVLVDQNNITNLPGVYAGGDAVTGAATVISAMGAGRSAAKSIARQLNGKYIN
ncbi:MAG: NADPH-dependent glutamate synthase [Christensenellaceae bacterium]|jgi:glutamate synthase (NADPH/NADH) small chain|nr:NADPH-dependent glutamate synthase [Christensenellaceae bacterium]